MQVQYSPRMGYEHGDVGGVLLVALEADGVPARAARAEDRGVVRADDEGVSARKRKVLRERGGLVDVVPN